MKTLFAEPTAMRKLGIVLAGGVALMVMQGAATAALTGIAATKHNLSSTNSIVGANKFTASNNTSEICAFCHTPHGADTSAPAPLWNRVMSSPAIYTTYAALGTSTLDGATAPVGSVSLACLSCHDGTQAMNTVINQSGSGGYVSSGSVQAGDWTGNAATAGIVGSLGNAGIALIGTDLSNDHPVGIQYAGGGFLSSDNLAGTGGQATGTPVDPDFVKPNVKGNGTTATFWVETGADTTRSKTDLILYSRSETTVGGGAAQPFVECASCHDPHTGTNPTFLRKTNVGSALCLACHTK